MREKPRADPDDLDPRHHSFDIFENEFELRYSDERLSPRDQYFRNFVEAREVFETGDDLLRRQRTDIVLSPQTPSAMSRTSGRRLEQYCASIQPFNTDKLLTVVQYSNI